MSLRCPHGVGVFASMGNGGDRKWARDSGLPQVKSRRKKCALYLVPCEVADVGGDWGRNLS